MNKTIRIFAILILVLFFAGLILLPRKLAIKEEITINKADTLVFKELIDFKNWQNWFPTIDSSSIEIKIHQSDNPLQSKISWYSDTTKSFHTQVRIKSYIRNEKLRLAYSFLNQGNKSHLESIIYIRPAAANRSKVIWEYENDLNFFNLPERLSSYFIQQSLAKVYKDGLEKLKKSID